MPATNPTSEEDIIKLVTDNEGITQRDTIKLLQCGQDQLRRMQRRLVFHKELFIHRKQNEVFYYTFEYAKAHKIPARAKRTTPAYGKELARLDGKKDMSATERKDKKALTGQKLFNSCWMVPSRSAT